MICRFIKQFEDRDRNTLTDPDKDSDKVQVLASIFTVCLVRKGLPGHISTHLLFNAVTRSFS